jgi:hypothetical protein
MTTTETRNYCLPLPTIEKIRQNRWLIDPDEIQRYEELASLDLEPPTLFFSLTAIAQQVAVSEIHSEHYSQACRQGAHRAMVGLIALLMVQPSSDLVDVEHKAIASMLIGDLEEATALHAAVLAVLRYEAGRFMQNASPAAIDVWIASARSRAPEN